MVSRWETLASLLFNTIFPDECRLCEKPLTNVSRIPVCFSCLTLPQPLQMDYFCRMCHTPFVSAASLDEAELCVACRQSLVNFDSAYSFGSYEGPLKDLIGLFKYGKVESLSKPLSRLLLKSLPSGENFDIIIAMPMHWRKQWQRGFNQAELLAEPVARRYGIKPSRALRRIRYTPAQAGLNERQRQNNLKHSFAVRRDAEISNRRILLIDDVFTTGATLRAAAAALKTAGAARVTALTVARVDHRHYQADGQRARLQPSGRRTEFESSASRAAILGAK